MKIVTLLTDFGLEDPYVGIMKGVILKINPDVAIVDITHAISPQDVKEAAFIINEYQSYFQAGTVHVAVVDPTVGSERRPLVLSKDGQFFVGPDNGIFSRLIRGSTGIYEIRNKDFMLENMSFTFHGRDIFAPAAAHLASGVQPSAFGPAIENPVYLTGILPVIVEGALSGEVVRLDRFGNAITNIDMTAFNEFTGDRPYRITIGRMAYTSLNQSYYERDFTCLAGSSGYIEFGHYKGSLAEARGVTKGDPVRVELLSA
jgi:S-adenosyl-L-methionine hydrolase (adenosine-forming)